MIALKNRSRAAACGLAFTLAGAAVLSVVMPRLARAVDFPASGEISFDRYAMSTIVGSSPVSVRRGIVFTDVAISRNKGSEGPWYDLSDRCAGQFTMLGEEPISGFGTCVKSGKDGDAVFVTWQGEDWTIVGGTGKYQGITGSGTTFANPGRDQVRGRPDGWVSVVHHTVKWQINPARASRSSPAGVANAGLGG